MHRLLAFVVDLARLALLAVSVWAVSEFGLFCRGLMDKFGIHR